MPIKKRASAVQERSSACAPYAPCKFWIVFTFLLLAAGIFVVGSITALLYKQQINIVRYVDALNGQTARASQALFQGQSCQYHETEVKGLYLAYQPCKATYTGACDDAALYRLAADGSKQVMIPSLRGLPGAPLTNELLQPIEQSIGGQYVVMAAWAYGAERNANDHRIWIFDLAANQLMTFSQNVPAGAIFSPDYAYAAYATASDGDLTDLMIINLAEDKVVSGAKAKPGYALKAQDGSISISWQDAKNLYVTQYPKNPSADEPATGEQIHVKVK